jgi:pimeloyl-ACP methyl ester carboxylesterase
MTAAKRPPRHCDDMARRVSMLSPRPAGRAGQIRCPLLDGVCDNDLIAPVRAAVRVARAAPEGQLRRYPLGHFDVFTGPGFRQVIADQVEFLRDALHP